MVVIDLYLHVIIPLMLYIKLIYYQSAMIGLARVKCVF